MTDNQLKELLQKYAYGTATDMEVRELTDMLKRNEHEEAIKGILERMAENTLSDHSYDPGELETVIQRILISRSGAKVIPLKRRWFGRVAAAAVIAVLLLTGSYFYFNKKKAPPVAKTEQHYKNDVAPGGNRAILTLANGQQIILDSAAKGTLTQQGNTKIVKLDSGQLAYNALKDPSASPGATEILYNTISTPRGGQYQVVLADGSKVWLNAGSSLRFPTAFTGEERKVELTGEGYFEVAHNPSKPFRVGLKGMQVEVLGTHFNINGYDDESSIKTTLLEGRVKVSKSDHSVIIKPGQQARLNKNSELKIMDDANLDETIAWKNGVFRFESQDIATIMRQLSRWYDIDVNYKATIDRHFTGIISRNVNASEVLKMLEMTGEMHFSIEGKKVIVEK